MDENNDEDTSFDEGERVYLGFKNWVTFYPLPWGVQRRLKAVWDTAFSPRSAADIKNLEEWQGAVAAVLFESARRGDPEFTLDKLLDMIDSRNVIACFRALRVASGFKAAKPAEEADAVRPTPVPRGDDSTLGSLEQPVGPLPTAMN